MEPRRPQKSPSPARNRSAFYLERELQGTGPSLSLLLCSRIFEHDLNRTLALHRLCQAKHCQLPRRSARDAKHRFFFTPVLRSVRLFLCKNRFKILLAQEPRAAAKAARFSLLPAKGTSDPLSGGIFLTGGAASGSRNPSAPRPGREGLWGQLSPLVRMRWVIPGRRTGCYQESRMDDRKEMNHSDCIKI